MNPHSSQSRKTLPTATRSANRHVRDAVSGLHRRAVCWREAAAAQFQRMEKDAGNARRQGAFTVGAFGRDCQGYVCRHPVRSVLLALAAGLALGLGWRR